VDDLAHAVESHTVAEGVGNTEQDNTLYAIGCERAQGYLYLRPIDPVALVELVYEQRGRVRVSVDESGHRG
jgi:EAL domain-containing protein (putative c-di-GMP-specific phosphodiesterase class I)